MKKGLFVSLVLVSSVGHAQVVVPPIDKTAFAVPMFDSPEPTIQLSPKEEKALEIVRTWKKNPGIVRKAEDGTIVYLFGATLPTLVCSFPQICSIRLQQGETTTQNSVHSGDGARWEIGASAIGRGANEVGVIMVRPRDNGITTNLIINTNRRSYTIKLVSAKREWMPAIAFDYPEEMDRSWAEYESRQQQVREATTMSNGVNIAAMDFAYSMSGDSPKWKPQRIFSDGVKTYIQFQTANFRDEAPVLVVVGKGKSLWSGPTTKQVNYRPVGDTYVVDQVIEKAALISGVGAEEVKVNIEYIGGKER